METYFKKLNQELKNYQRAIPCLLVDLDILDSNIETLKRSLYKTSSYRVVVKSLPSFELLEYIMKKTKTNKLMVFHQPFLSDLSSKLNENADVLIGKPMPIKTAEYFYKNVPELSKGFNPDNQIQWLVDSEKRIEEYVSLAQKLNKKLRLNIEIDVGLHRGGFSTLTSLRKGLELIKENQQYVAFSGFMGYDPHVVKLPEIIRSKEKALQLANHFYKVCIDLIKTDFSILWNENLTFNGAGSPTINLHNTSDSPINDIAAGSCLVKPTTFDIPTLKEYQPASFIATPVLKQFKKTSLPGLENFNKLLSFFNINKQPSYFIYGGFWKADYWFPKEIKPNKMFGNSTNQTMINSSKSANLNVDDFVFLRPHQSEFVFLQFGEILPIRKGKILEPWSLLNNRV